MTNRPLTPEELDLAPEWAVEYSNTNGLVFVSSCLGCHAGGFIYKFYHTDDGTECLGRKYPDIQPYSPIPQKHFDIESVEWSDSDIQSVEIDEDGVIINGADCDISMVRLNKRDVIAIAKALGIAAEDLK